MNNEHSETNVPLVSEETKTLGDIQINFNVVANIVRIAALEVPGVATVGGGLVDGIADMFPQKKFDRGVRVKADEVGDYIIDIKVILKFGVELAHVAEQAQHRIIEQVEKMTSRSVSLVNVIVDGVKTTEKTQNEDWDEETHTD
ncbi:Asp23/Gls24 family envelope stress response protein [Opitutae bacterium]|nr:Asp23/Gls24 family envelope stress response protein [Opitutae bacterium]